MAEKIEKVLINNDIGRFTINFLGNFPNKWANPGGKIYLTEKEWDFVKVNLSHILEKGFLSEEGSEKVKVKTKAKDETELAKFFDQNTNKAKAQVKKMELNDVNELIEYANDHEIDNALVTALMNRANELGE